MIKEIVFQSINYIQLRKVINSLVEFILTMFGNSKEYQDLKKLYEERVSKPEKLDEFVGLGVKGGGTSFGSAVKMGEKLRSGKVIPKPNTGTDTEGIRKPIPQRNTGTDNPPNKMAEKDLSDIKKEAGLQKALNNKKNLQKIETDAIAKTKAKADADKKEVDFRLKNTETSEQSAKAEARPKRRPVPSPMEAGMGPGAARARAMARKRIAAKKANPDQKQLSGRERAQAIAKARIADKKTTMEEYTPYDIILEYLLSTEQVATIEEANYVMTEMDAETIQGIVEEQKKKLSEGLGKVALVTGGLVAGKMALDAGKKRFDKFLNNQRNKSNIGGNKRVDDVRAGSGNNKVGEKIYYGK